MKRFAHIWVMLLFVAGSLMTSGCFTQQHIVGDGAQTGRVEEQRAWYILWGLVPINPVDTNSMADGAADYEVKTEFTPVDFVIGLFTSIITVQPMTVTVTR